ncbi:MAG TPA: YciI family protein [Pyrinomonadaceae bacterium]|nr:YciI family protein [Pyrinomonadaceae bacterium]
MKKLFATSVVLFFLCAPLVSRQAMKGGGKKQFAYVLRLTPRLRDEKNWTEADNAAVGRHFRRLQRLHGEGKVVLAGKTLDDADEGQFGVVILEVSSEEEARKIMEGDDAVREEIMTARLFPFRVALIR